MLSRESDAKKHASDRVTGGSILTRARNARVRQDGERAMNCWRCGAAIEAGERVGFRDCCPKCDRPLHVCRNCGFHDAGYHNQCRETMAELVADKERGNFCEYFKPAAARARRANSPPAAGDSVREKLEDLFKPR